MKDELEKQVSPEPTDELRRSGACGVRILPCPFCGGEAEILESWLNKCSKKNHKFYPTCKGKIRDNCPGINEEQDEQGGISCECGSIAEAVKLWNLRA